MQLTKYVKHRVGAAGIHRKALTLPVRGGTHLFQLVYDAAAVLFLPLPALFQKAFPPEVILVNPLLFETLDHLDLGRDRGMVRPRLP